MRAELLGRPVERAGLGREADEDRDRAERLARRCAVAVEAADDPRDLGQQVRRRLELEGQRRRRGRACVSAASAGRKSATAAAITRASKPAAPSEACSEPQQRGAHVGGRLDPDDAPPPSGSGDLDVRRR